MRYNRQNQSNGDRFSCLELHQPLRRAAAIHRRSGPQNVLFLTKGIQPRWFPRCDQPSLTPRTSTMVEHRPIILVSSDPNLTAELNSFLHERVSRRIVCCTYENCREAIVWSLRGQVVLAAATAQDCASAAVLVRECCLRRSPCS